MLERTSESRILVPLITGYPFQITDIDPDWGGNLSPRQEHHMLSGWGTIPLLRAEKDILPQFCWGSYCQVVRIIKSWFIAVGATKWLGSQNNFLVDFQGCHCIMFNTKAITEKKLILKSFFSTHQLLEIFIIPSQCFQSYNFFSRFWILMKICKRVSIPHQFIMPNCCN